jgi:hypothetical protein
MGLEYTSTDIMGNSRLAPRQTYMNDAWAQQESRQWNSK